jgi:hypothetical protein
MNLAQKIQSEISDIPAEVQAEVLDFIQFLKQRRQAAKAPAPVFSPGKMGVAVEKILQPLGSQAVEFFLAVALYHARKISFSAAANLAGLSFEDFATHLREHFRLLAER